VIVSPPRGWTGVAYLSHSYGFAYTVGFTSYALKGNRFSVWALHLMPIRAENPAGMGKSMLRSGVFVDLAYLFAV
jgi:hypothetical protein